VLLALFGEADSEAVQEQITRVLLERLIVHRPHPVSMGDTTLRHTTLFITLSFIVQ
jgi:CCR4-Not complex component, Not1